MPAQMGCVVGLRFGVLGASSLASLPQSGLSSYRFWVRRVYGRLPLSTL
jgi:hypothetical protein